VVVAVIVVWVVQVARHRVVHVIAMLDGLVTAVRTMPVFRFVLGAIVTRRAAGGVGLGDGDVAHMRLALPLFSSLSLARPAYSWRFGEAIGLLRSRCSVSPAANSADNG